MKILFISISELPHLSKHSISLDLLHELKRHGNEVYVVCALERKKKLETSKVEENGCTILRVKIGNNKKANIIEKGLTTLIMPQLYINAIKKYYSDVKFDLVIYPTPPVTVVDVVKFIKKRDEAKSYLLLKDIFPQNAVDLGLMSKTGVKSIIYMYFRRKEKELYAISDCIGCMSQANIDYIIMHNPHLNSKSIEVCPNSIEVLDMRLNQTERENIRIKYAIPLDRKVYIYGGNLGIPQGISFLIDCLRSQVDNEKVYFLIVGDGSEYSRLEKFFTDVQPENMKLMKQMEKEDFDRMVAACDVGMIFLDHRFTIPNFPSRLLSYMQAGLAVLACTDKNTDIGEIITKGGFGWWCESNEVNGFIKLIESANKVDLKVMGDIGYKFLYNNYNIYDSYKLIMKHWL